MGGWSRGRYVDVGRWMSESAGCVDGWVVVWMGGWADE